MFSPKHILVVLDPTQVAQPALERAIHLANEYRASLELFLVTYQDSIVSNWFLDEQHLAGAKAAYLAKERRWMQTYLDELQARGLTATIDLVWHKSVAQGILDRIRRGDVDLVCKHSKPHSPMNIWFSTPNDWQLLTDCPVPLLLVKSSGRDPYRQLLAAVDPGHHRPDKGQLDHKIIGTTLAIAEHLGGATAVCHFYQPIALELWHSMSSEMADFGPEIPSHTEYVERLQDSHRQPFRALVEDYHFDEQQLILREGQASEGLCALVPERSVDLLVMGTAYHSGVLGSTVEKGIDGIGCDVLAIKADNFVSQR